MMPVLITLGRKFKSLFYREASTALEVAERRSTEFTKTVDGYVAPVRKTIFRRFPVLFSLLVTLGVSATVLGLEQILLQYQILQESPVLIFLFGMSILIFTGTLYKKLS